MKSVKLDQDVALSSALINWKQIRSTRARTVSSSKVLNGFYLDEDGQDNEDSASDAKRTSMEVASLGYSGYRAYSWGTSRWSTGPLVEPAQMGQWGLDQRHVVDT